MDNAAPEFVRFNLPVLACASRYLSSQPIMASPTHAGSRPASPTRSIISASSSSSYESLDSTTQDSTITTQSDHKISTKGKFKSLFQSLTPRQLKPSSVVGLKYKLNIKKQSKNLQKSLINYSPFKLENFTLSPQGLSATLPNVHPVTFKQFEAVTDQFCSGGVVSHPSCNVHKTPVCFTRQENRDKSDSQLIVTVVYKIQEWIGGSHLGKNGSLTLHLTKRKIQVQASRENVPLLLEHLIAPLMLVTANLNCVDLSLTNCLDCTKKSISLIPTSTPVAANIQTHRPQLAITNCSTEASSPSLSVQSSTTPEQPKTSKMSHVTSQTSMETTPNQSIPKRALPLPDFSALSPNIPASQQSIEIKRLSSCVSELQNSIVNISCELHTLKGQYNKLLIKSQNDDATIKDLSQKYNESNQKLNEISSSMNEKTKAFNEFRSNLATKPKNSVQAVPDTEVQKLKKDLSDVNVTLNNMDTTLTTTVETVGNLKISHQQQSQLVNDLLSNLKTIPPPITPPQAPPQPQIQPPRTEPSMLQPSAVTHTRLKMFGASNTGKISNALRNVIPDIVIDAKSGATFDSMAGDIAASNPCDVIVIAGGVNESDTLRNLELARHPLKEAIRVAKTKSKKVVVMPPPPLTHERFNNNIARMTNIMRYEAKRANVEFVEVATLYIDWRLNGVYISDKSGLHVNRLGGGIYAFALLQHLSNYHRQFITNLSFCVKCHHTGHTYDTCVGVKHTRRPASRTVPPRMQAYNTPQHHHGYHPADSYYVNTYNRFDPLSDYQQQVNYYV